MTPTSQDLVRYAVMRYASEKDAVGRQNKGTWQQVVDLLSKRDIRPEKSGKAFAPILMKQGAHRAKGNVVTIHMAVADIDTVGEKYTATGRVISVHRAAPTLSDLRSHIDQYTWAAYSSHWHEPQRNVTKYRVVLPLARPCTPDEWPNVWDGFNILLQGHCDAACKDAARVYYLPSCPTESHGSAFFETNDGALLDPDLLIGMARQQDATRAADLDFRNFDSKANHPVPVETPEEIERVNFMLATVKPDCDYHTWRNVVWAIASTGWNCAKDVAWKWSKGAPGKFDESNFLKVWHSFDAGRGIGFGTLVHYAAQNGYLTTQGNVDWMGADIENGRRFADTFRDRLLRIHETGDDLTFDQKAGWLFAPPCAVERAAKSIRDQMHREATELFKNEPHSPLTKRAVAEVSRVSKAVNLRAMIQMAMSEPGLTRSLTEFDADPMKLGMTNGVLDLNSVALLPISPTLLVTKRCNVPYEPAAACPQWERFLVDVQPDPAMREFLQRWAGYCLTGLVREQKFIFPHGSGANGKSVFVETLAWLMGDYARKVATEMFMHHQRNPQGPSPDIVSLKGMRFVYANETEEGRKLADARIKDMTGGDTLTGRVLYAKNDITFAPTHKLAIVGNHKPEIRDTSQGMWRRVCLVPFDVTVPEYQRDGKLPEKLRLEGAGILNWALSGLQKYLRNGLAIPKEIEVATAAYRDEQDIVGHWITECCTTGPSLKMKKDDAYHSYQIWCSRSGYHAMAQGRLTRRLTERNYRLLPDKRTIGGIALNQIGTSPPEQ